MFVGSSEAFAQQVSQSPSITQAIVPTTAPAALRVAPVSQVTSQSVIQAIIDRAERLLPTLTAPAAAAPAQPALPLAALVEANAAGDALDEQAQCMATAVYFESKGEPLEGQLAVAQVVMNRAQSGKYPASWCAVVKQHAQFSFVRHGEFPRIDANCQAWRNAQAITRIAMRRLATSLPGDVLWYHANYVAPAWRRNLTRVDQIGAHIFYRA